MWQKHDVSSEANAWFTSNLFLREPYRHMRVRNLGLEELARIQWTWIGHSELSILERASKARKYFERTFGGILQNNTTLLSGHPSIRIQGEQTVTHQTQMPLKDLDMITSISCNIWFNLSMCAETLRVSLALSFDRIFCRQLPQIVFPWHKALFIRLLCCLCG